MGRASGPPLCFCGAGSRRRAREGSGVIALTRLNGHPLMVNCDLIESLEETPDTVVTLTSGNKLIVRDSMLEVQRKIVEFKRKIYGPLEPGR